MGDNGTGVSSDIVAVTILIALGAALITELIGVHPLFGAFLAGAIVPREGGVAVDVAERIEYVVVGVLLPCSSCRQGCAPKSDFSIWVSGSSVA